MPVDQVFPGGDKIEKRVLLGIELAVEMPPLPVLGAAADMGNGVDKAAIDQAEDMRGERGRHREPV